MKKILSILAFFVFCTAARAQFPLGFYAGGSGSGAFVNVGTAEGQMLYWDNTAGEWKPATDLVFENANGSLVLSGGDASNPSLALGNGDTGLYESADDQVVLSAGVVAGIRVTETASAITTDLYGTVNAGPIRLNSTAISNDGDSEGITIADNGDVTHSDGTVMSGAQFVNVTTVNAATYDLLTSDYILNVTYTGTGAVTSLTLPTAQVVSGRVIVVVDAGGGAGANNITIDTEGAETISGAATHVLTVNYQSVMIYSDGANWFVF